MKYKEIIEQVAKELGLPKEVVEKTYRAYFLYIKKMIQKLPLMQSPTEEEFGMLNTNFNIPSLGKFTCSYERMQKVHKRLEYVRGIKRKKNEYKEN